MTNPPDARFPKRKTSLSKRQEEVLQLVAHGLHQHEIADELGISVKTVQQHLEDIYRFLGARNAPHAVYIAIGEGMLV